MDYFDFDENSVKRGEALSHNRFSRFFTKNYKDYIYVDHAWINGKTERVFSGVRLKTPEEIMEWTKENASMQVAAAPTVQNVTLVAEPEDDEKPFD
jgi:hypothetical protein